MAASQSQKAKKSLAGDKSIPDHIIDGSIVIDSVEAFKSILKQFPDDAYLLKAYSDFLAKNNLYDLAAKSYSDAASLFVKTGKFLQAIVSKKLQWRIQSAKKEEVREFLDLLKKDTVEEIPLKIFFSRLTREEILAIINCFVRARLPAGKVVKKKGDGEINLYFIVSGTLKDSLYPSLEEKVRVHRPSDIFLNENQFFGDVYPFDEERISESDIETTTQVELVKLPKPALIQLCKKFPNIELGLIELCKIRNNPDNSKFFKSVRKEIRYHVPIDMNLEIYPNASADVTFVVEGYSSDISVGGICVILDSNNSQIESVVEAFEKKTNGPKIWIGLPAETMHIKVLGRVAWSHPVVVDGKKTLVIGIQFQKLSPRLRGILFMFASSLERQE
jgi:CRP-like cAMP-binding protein